MIWQYLNDISTAYVFGGSRYEPYDTDCSGIVCAGFWQKLGIEPSQLGTWTGAQWASPILETIWEGTTPNLPWNLMQEDDLIFTSTESPFFDSEWGSHVGLYTGDSNMPFLSHFKDGGPFITKVNGVYGGMECYFGVRRLKVLDTREIIEKLDQIMKYLPAWVWEYNYENTAPDGNMYNCAVQGRMMLQDVLQNRNRANDSIEKVLTEIEALNSRLDVIEKKLNDIR